MVGKGSNGPLDKIEDIKTLIILKGAGFLCMLRSTEVSSMAL